MFGVTPMDARADGKGWSGDAASQAGPQMPLWHGRPDPLANLLEKDKKQKSGGFQTMGFSKEILKAIQTMGFNVPTPVQRKAMPPMMQGSDIVAMARTGSGKTAAFVLPTLHNLGSHSGLVGIRCLILSPTRELALQILDAVRALGKHTNLTSNAIVGGKSLDAQFTDLAMNPDILVATPGRLLHVLEEAEMKLKRVSIIILDEADRLFELGLQPQIVSIMQQIPDGAQRALFSATMPTVLAEFTKAGLRSPVVVRLDAEMKLSDKLQQSSFVVRSDEKIAALMVILRHVIGVRRKSSLDYMDKKLASEKERALAKNKRFVQKTLDRIKEAKEQRSGDHRDGNKKRKATYEYGTGEVEADEYEREEKGDIGADGVQALVFVESKHHVEFLTDLMALYEIPASGVHGQMDQEARKLAVEDFAKRRTAVLFVTDVAARGIDLPLLDNVVNFSFPQQPKLFVHRVGRVARAGRSGCAYSLMTMEDLPSYVDLMEFLDLEVKCSLPKSEEGSGEETSGFQAMLSNPYDGYFGRLPEERLQSEYAFLKRAIDDNVDLAGNYVVIQRAHKKFLKTKKKSSANGMRLAKRYTYETVPLHPVLLAKQSKKDAEADAAKIALRAFKAKETYLDIVHGSRVFEVKKPIKPQLTILRKEENNGPAEVASESQLAALSVNAKRKKGAPSVAKSAPVDAAPKPKLSLAESMLQRAAVSRAKRDREDTSYLLHGTGSGTYSEANKIFGGGAADGNGNVGDQFKDDEYFMADRPEVRETNQQFSVMDATLDINADSAEDASKARSVYAWNKRKNRYQKMNVNDAKALVKGIKNEAGKKIDFKKSKLDAYSKWMKTTNLRIQDIGEEEDQAAVERAKTAAKAAKYGQPVDDEEAAIADQLHKDPNMGKQLKVGRKLKRLTKDGSVRNFTEMLNKKQKKAKQDGKLEARRAKKAAKRGAGPPGAASRGPSGAASSAKRGFSGPKKNYGKRVTKK